jgi:hypothetical protein
MPDPVRPPPKTQQKPAEANATLDRTLEDSFPASDPPSQTGVTGPGEPAKKSPKRG